MSDALEVVVARVAALGEPWRIAVDGVTAAGKTTVADGLGERLGAFRLTIDDFHRPPPHEYYPESFDLVAFRGAVLAARGNVVADGVFLQHPQLRDLWDLTVFLAADRAVALERALARDAGRMENARERYATRYVPGETRYLEEVDPAALADVVIDSTELDRLRLVRG